MPGIWLSFELQTVWDVAACCSFVVDFPGVHDFEPSIDMVSNVGIRSSSSSGLGQRHSNNASMPVAKQLRTRGLDVRSQVDVPLRVSTPDVHIP